MRPRRGQSQRPGRVGCLRPGAPSVCLCPELIPCVLIDSCAPELGGFAAAYVPNVDEILIEGLGASFTGLMHKHDNVIIGGGEVVDLQPERAAGEFHELCEAA